MPPVVHPRAKALWETEDVQEWSKAFSAYDDNVRGRKSTKLTELDAFVTKEVPRRITERSPPHITGEEYVKIVEWKLTRGKNRPGLLNRAKELREDVVREASTKAFAAAREAKKENELVQALAPLTDLKGCGPATASAVMSLCDERYAFFSDEAFVVAIGNKSSNYTLARYRDFLHAISRKFEQLNDKTNTLTVSRLERALWSAASQSMTNKG